MKLYKCKNYEETIHVMQLLTNKIVLSLKDSLIFAEALLNPREPNDKLLQAMARHNVDVIESGN